MVKLRRVRVHLPGTSVLQGQLYSRWQREDTAPNMTRRCRRDLLLAYRLETAPAKNHALHYTLSDVFHYVMQFPQRTIQQ
jgi:hypothetical protein